MSHSEIKSPTEVRGDLLKASEMMLKRLGGLLDAKGKVADETHALRKLGKSLRGGLVLIEAPKSAVRAVSAVGRLLGAPRDSISRQTTWRRLGLAEGSHAEERSVAAIGALLDHYATAATRRPPEPVVAWAEVRLRHAVAALAAIPAEELDDRIRDGKHRLARRVLRRLKAVEKKPEVVQLHDLRKAIKAWLGALHHLNEKPASELVECADILGDINDLYVLGAWLSERGFTLELAPIPWRALKESLAIKLGKLLGSAPAVRRAISVR